MPICTKCGDNKPQNEFSKNSKKKSGYSTWCKQCFKAYYHTWYNDNNSKQKTRAHLRRAKIKQEIQNYIIQYLQLHPCIDCGESDPVVLEFDHIDPMLKTNNISTMVKDGFSLNNIITEIDKCEVRCANCHKRKTAQQFGWYKYTPIA